jgi:hypothetical protein
MGYDWDAVFLLDFVDVGQVVGMTMGQDYAKEVYVGKSEETIQITDDGAIHQISFPLIADIVGRARIVTDYLYFNHNVVIKIKI